MFIFKDNYAFDIFLYLETAISIKFLFMQQIEYLIEFEPHQINVLMRDYRHNMQAIVSDLLHIE